MKIQMFFLLSCALASAVAQQSPAKVEAHGSTLTMHEEEPAAQPQNAAEEKQLATQIEKNPEDVDALYRLALLQRLNGKMRESLGTYNKAAALRPPTAAQLRSVALDYVQLNEYPQAIHWLRIALGMAPDDIEILYSLGRCFYTENTFAQAEAAFGRVLQLNPAHIRAREYLGLTYDAENRPKQAEEFLHDAAQRALAAHDKDPWPYLNMGTFLLDQSRASDAVEWLKEAVELAPTEVSARENYGRALLAVGHAPEAVHELEEAARLAPNNPKVQFELGRAYREAGDSARSAAAFARSKELYGQHSQN